MQFEFAVIEAGKISGPDIVYLVGKLRFGMIKGGEQAVVKNTSDRFVTIKSVALVNAKELEFDVLTLAIDAPAFPLLELEGAVLVENQ